MVNYVLIPQSDHYDDRLHKKELREFVKFIQEELGWFVQVDEQDMFTKSTIISERNGKRLDGIVITRFYKIIFEYKTSKNIFRWYEGNPSIKIFLDDFLRIKETLEIYKEELRGFIPVYIYFNPIYKNNSRYLYIKINENTFRNADGIEDGRIIYTLDNPNVLNIEELSIEKLNI